jgi:hypothetical protein
MASEAIILELNADSDWDGVSPTALNRDDALVTGQRYYKFNVTGPHGILPADLGGLFSATSVKLIGIAHNFRNPGGQGAGDRVRTGSSVRQEITLRPDVQFVTLFPGDRLALLTKDTRVQIVLVVNEMNEAESVRWGLAHHPPRRRPAFGSSARRGSAFAPNALTSAGSPSSPTTSPPAVMVALDDGTGVIPRRRSASTRAHEGCYVSLRYAGSNADGKVHIVDPETRKSWIAETALPDVKWSKVQYIGARRRHRARGHAGRRGSEDGVRHRGRARHDDSRLRARYQGGL